MVLPEETYRLTGKVLEGGEAWFVFVDRWETKRAGTSAPLNPCPTFTLPDLQFAL